MKIFTLSTILSFFVLNNLFAQIDTFYTNKYFEFAKCRYYNAISPMIQPDTVFALSIYKSKDLANLQIYKNLHCLLIDFGYNTKIKIDKKYNFKKLPIKYLEINGCKKLIDTGIDSLYLDSLQSIYITMCPVMTLPKFISNCPNLKQLCILEGLKTIDETVSLPESLVSLRIEGLFRRVPYKVFNLKNLQLLEITNFNYPHQPFENIADYDFMKLPKLRSLSIDMSLNKVNIIKISNLQCLESLIFENYEGDITDLSILQKMPKLKSIYISTLNVTDKMKLKLLLPYINVN